MSKAAIGVVAAHYRFVRGSGSLKGRNPVHPADCVVITFLHQDTL